MLKYRYALGADNKTHDILEMKDETRRLGSPYRCFGCGSELIPNLPKTGKTKYYSHKIQQNCAKETYLHYLAKNTFFESYKKALANGKPYIFSYRRNYSCNFHESTLSYLCRGQEFADFDLTKIYTQITLEKKIGDYIPDIALLSEKHPSIFIEIAVTHKSSQQKVASGEK